MSQSVNTGVTHIEPNQSGKDVTANAGFDRLSRFITNSLDIAVTGDVAVTEEQFQTHMRFRLTGTPGAAFLVDLPATVARACVVQNTADATATLQVPGAGGVTLELEPSQAMMVYTDGTNVDGLLVASNPPYDIGFFYPESPDAGVTMVQYVAPRALELPAGVPGGSAFVGTAPADGDAVFTLLKNGAQVGSLTFASGAQTGTFSVASNVSLAVGDRIALLSPDPADSALADVSVTLPARRIV